MLHGPVKILLLLFFEEEEKESRLYVKLDFTAKSLSSFCFVVKKVIKLKSIVVATGSST